MYQKIDRDNNGMIDLEEMEAFSDGVFENQFESLLGRTVNSRELFSILDHNNDG